MAKIVRLTEEDLVHLVKRVIEEQTAQSQQDISCLVNAGFKKDSIGGPQVRRTVYSGKVGESKHQYSPDGGVFIFGNGTRKQGSWKCDSSSPNGIKIFAVKDVQKFAPF